MLLSDVGLGPNWSVAFYRPNRLIVDEATSDDNSGEDLIRGNVLHIMLRVISCDSEPRHDGDLAIVQR